jgi:hypothetical protein
MNQNECSTPLNPSIINHNLANQISNLMLSKLLMLENFIITIHPNSPKQKSCQALPNIYKSLRKVLAKEALTYKQSYPKIYKDKKKRG